MKEETKKLNQYLNDAFKYLEEHYDPLLWNLIYICRINDRYRDILDKYDLNNTSIENNLTYADVISIARDIINSINPKYLPDFDNLLNSGQLDFSYENEYCGSHFYHDRIHNEININRSFNYNDVRVLVHEFFHYTNGKDGTSFNNNLLTEFFSIYFEIYAIEYLLESGIDKSEIDYKARLRWNYNTCNAFYEYEIPLLAYYNFGSIDEKSYGMLTSYFLSDEYKEESFNEECKNLLEYFKGIEEKYKKENFTVDYDEEEIGYRYCGLFIDWFKYVLGTLLAFYAKDNCKIDDIIYMNDHINDENIGFYECLDKMGINMEDNELEDRIFDSIETYLKKCQIKKR